MLLLAELFIVVWRNPAEKEIALLSDEMRPEGVRLGGQIKNTNEKSTHSLMIATMVMMMMMMMVVMNKACIMQRDWGFFGV